MAGRFIRRGWSSPRVRLEGDDRRVLFVPLSPMVALAASVQGSLAFALLIVFIHLAWLANMTALIVEVVPRASLGVVFGIVAAGSSAGSMMMNSFVARLLQPNPLSSLVQPGAYTRWYFLAAWMHLAGQAASALGRAAKEKRIMPRSRRLAVTPILHFTVRHDTMK